MQLFPEVASRRRQRGGTLVGLMAGLVIGLAIAVAVAIFVTRSPVPFVNRIAKSPDRIEPKTGVDAPDPNKPLHAKPRAGTAANPIEPGANKPSVLGGILNNPDNKPAPPTVATAPTNNPAATPSDAPISASQPSPSLATAPAAEPKSAEPPKEDRVNYTLQAGAFKSQDDADNMKARLALVGYEARILTAEVNGQTLYRVRVGPYVGLDDMTKARGKLAESGIEAAVIRQR